MERDYIQDLALYLSNFVSYDKGTFKYEPVRSENVIDIINLVVQARCLKDYVSNINISYDINNNEAYSMDNSNVKGNSVRLGSYIASEKTVFIKLDEKSNIIDICYTILHELEHAYQAKMINNISCDDSEIDIFTSLYYLDHRSSYIKYPYSKQDYILNKEITSMLNNAYEVQYYTSPRERFARLNAASDLIKIIRLMGYGDTILARNYEFKYRDYLDCGYYQTKKYTLNPLHIFLLRLYNNNVIDERSINDLLDLLNEYTKDLDEDKRYFLGLKVNSNK